MRALATINENLSARSRCDCRRQEWFVHSITPVKPLSVPPRIPVGGADCTKPYDMAFTQRVVDELRLLIRTCYPGSQRGAAKGEFAHDTGEGGISPHHLAGEDLVWEIGTAYFGARTADVIFDPQKFAELSAMDAVKMVSLKLSQGAKPGIGGVLPQAKITEEIARDRVFHGTKNALVRRITRSFRPQWNLSRFIATMRELSGGKPAGLSYRDFTTRCLSDL